MDSTGLHLDPIGLHWAPPAPCSSPLCPTWVPFGPIGFHLNPPLAPQGSIWALFEHYFSSIRVPLRSYALNLRPKWGSNSCVCLRVFYVLCVVCVVCHHTQNSRRSYFQSDLCFTQAGFRCSRSVREDGERSPDTVNVGLCVQLIRAGGRRPKANKF